MSQQPISMESALDEERLDVLSLLEGSSNKSNQGIRNSGDPAQGSAPAENPPSPVRSMLDIDNGPTVPHTTTSETSGRTSSSSKSGSMRSMLDIGEGQAGVTSTPSPQTSPMDVNQMARGSGSGEGGIQAQGLSDGTSRPVNFRPQSLPDRSLKADPISDYQFSGYLPSNPGGPVVPKRNTLAGKLSNNPADGGDPNNRGLRNRGRHHSLSGAGIGMASKSDSKSPHNRLSMRSNSPQASMLNTNAPSRTNNTSLYSLNNGKFVDLNSAYRRLSDANLASADGCLSTLPSKASRRRGEDVDPASSTGGRIEEDDAHLGEDDATVESSDEYEMNSSDEDIRRGRKKGSAGVHNDANESQATGIGRAKGPRQALTLLAAAEQEREEVAKHESYKVRSLLEPEITITGPAGDRQKPSKKVIHPANSFDQGVSEASTPLDSDTEADITDIKRAQRLAVIMTPVVSTPGTNRCVRTIYRGDFAKMQQEALDDQRRVRKYLVATDLSDEAQHALEWTVGTVLRDGDTLLAIYCVDEETGIGETATDQDQSIKDQAASIAAITNTPQQINVPGSRQISLSPLGALTGSIHSPTPSPAGFRPSAEHERHRAVQHITDRVSKLLRKTRLQVRIVIEVIHCKSPKHLITEVIDYVSPTLVILGSRGRSALKGVILGSFSNYLVTKSSVPVMVARKRLRKHGKYKRPAVRLANNLTNISGRTLASAKVD
ncbi:MAG: hypothetical protein M1818_008457 [Claussenomyces sp. TS43310]|nr:MAG: hypothetical protein M1818_008457 [Claussenomyces sp. TS43310]